MKARTRNAPAHAAPASGAGAVADDGRDARELNRDENARLCEGCVKCCTYITIEIDPPRHCPRVRQHLDSHRAILAGRSVVGERSPCYRHNPKN